MFLFHSWNQTYKYLNAIVKIDFTLAFISYPFTFKDRKMKKIITIMCCFVCLGFSLLLTDARSSTSLKITSPVSSEIVNGLFTVKVAYENPKAELVLCLIFVDGTNDHRQMFYENGFYYCNIDSRKFVNGNLYFFVKNGKNDELIEDTPVVSVIIDNSESSIIGQVEPLLTRNGSIIQLTLKANIPLKNVWVSLEDGIKFELSHQQDKNQWESTFFVPLTFNEGSHLVQFEGVDAGGSYVKTNTTFMVCNSEPFFTFPMNGVNILSEQIDLKGQFSPGEKVFVYRKIRDNQREISHFVSTTISDEQGLWIFDNISLFDGINTFSVFSKKPQAPVETFPYQTIKVEKYEKGLVVLNYHNIAKQGGMFSRTPEQFKEDMTFLKENGFNPVTPVLYLSYLEGKGSLPEKPVLITFDDGLNGVYFNAYPVLKEFNFTAILFIIVSRIGQNLDYLTWKQLSEMQGSRVFSVESHTYNSHFFVDNISGRHAALISKLILPDGSIESEEQYINRVTDDLQKSKAIVEDKLNKKVLFLSIPFGNGDPSITRIANQLGYKGSFNSGGGVNPLPLNSWNVKRITVKSTDSLSDYLY